MSRQSYKKLRAAIAHDLGEHRGGWLYDEHVLAEVALACVLRDYHVVPRSALPCVVFPQPESPEGP